MNSSKVSFLNVIKRSGSKTDENYVILENGITTSVRASLLEAKIGISGAIRILKEEYENINLHANYYTHFNLELSGHSIGKRYALPKVLVQGYFKNEEDELPPLLSFEEIYFGSCVRVKEKVSYQELSSEDFAYSMLNIKNAEELIAVIRKRYNVSLPLLSDKEILRRGVSVTTLKLEQ